MTSPASVTVSRPTGPLACVPVTESPNTRSTSPPLGWKLFESSYGGPALDCVHCEVWHAEVRIHRSAEPVSVESAQVALSRGAFLDQRLLTMSSTYRG